MPFVTSGAVVVVVALLACLGGCGGAGGSPRSCGSDGECGNLARCLNGSCVEDTAPVAVLGVPAAVEAFSLVEFDGSASSDPDAALEDEVAAFHWSFTSLDDHCAAPTATGTGATARVRFGCAGAFRVKMVVVDLKGKESAPVLADVTVAPRAGASMLVPSADTIVDHSCSGTPRQCTTLGPAPVVTAQLAEGIEPVGPVVYHWTVDSPDGQPFDAHKRVTFTPSDNAPDPTVYIEVDESALKALVDDWVFRVSASDDAGPLGEATTRISVANRRPTLAAAVAAVSVGHTYSAGYYRASANASRWTDPDGDPLQLAGSTASDPCASVTFGADGTATIQCTRPFSNALALAGFVATHNVTVRASDGWESAPSSSVTAVTIQNQAVQSASTSVSRPRSCQELTRGACCVEDPDSTTRCIKYYNACPALSAWVEPSISDPDGDPVQVAWTSGLLGSGTKVCLAGSNCGATYAAGAYNGCAMGGGTVKGTFTVTDGLTGAGPATLTVYY